MQRCLDTRHHIHRWVLRQLPERRGDVGAPPVAGRREEAAEVALAQLGAPCSTCSSLCHEPWVAARVIDELLAPHVATGCVTVLRQHEVIAVQTQVDLLCSVPLQDQVPGRERSATAALNIDATEIGNLLALAGVEHVLYRIDLHPGTRGRNMVDID